MKHFYHLVQTNDNIGIGDIDIDIDIDIDVAEDGSAFSVDRPISFKGFLMLFTNDGRPVFER